VFRVSPVQAVLEPFLQDALIIVEPGEAKAG
jgi:hypothetical protein